MIIPYDRLESWRASIAGARLVVASGCFDLLHVGHVRYLDAAARLGDILLVGVDSDASVRASKGAGRPIIPEDERAEVLGALRAVWDVCVFGDCVDFLRRARPHVWAKGGDYAVADLPAGEVAAVRLGGGCVVCLPSGSRGSTTGILGRIGEGRVFQQY